MAAKMGNKFVALCTVALGAVYTTGYVATQTPPIHTSQGTAISTSSTAKTDSSAKNSNTTHKQTTSSSTSSHSQSKAKSSAPSSAQKYLDGTYQGSGTNGIGTVYVAVTITHGKIANVQITECDTHYPESYIDPVLPQQVLTTQSLNVTNVSGATRSTEDFVNAVYEALSKAQNPHYKA